MYIQGLYRCIQVLIKRSSTWFNKSELNQITNRTTLNKQRTLQILRSGILQKKWFEEHEDKKQNQLKK